MWVLDNKRTFSQIVNTSTRENHLCNLNDEQYKRWLRKEDKTIFFISHFTSTITFDVFSFFFVLNNVRAHFHDICIKYASEGKQTCTWYPLMFFIIPHVIYLIYSLLIRQTTYGNATLTQKWPCWGWQCIPSENTVTLGWSLGQECFFQVVKKDNFYAKKGFPKLNFLIKKTINIFLVLASIRFAFTIWTNIMWWHSQNGLLAEIILYNKNTRVASP